MSRSIIDRSIESYTFPDKTFNVFVKFLELIIINQLYNESTYLP